MTERERMIEIVLDTEITGIKLRNITGGISTANAIADALIAAGIGDVTAHEAEAEYWKTICKFESDEHHTAIKNAAEHARHLMQERDEYKHRAEVAERAFDNTMKVFHEVLSVLFPDTNIDLDEWRRNNLANAERELAEKTRNDT